MLSIYYLVNKLYIVLFNAQRVENISYYIYITRKPFHALTMPLGIPSFIMANRYSHCWHAIFLFIAHHKRQGSSWYMA